MAIDPDTQAVLDMIRLAGRPPFETLTPAEARQAYSASRRLLQPPPEEVAETRDATVSGPHGPIPVRLYRPAGTAASDVLPALVYYHGGGWLLGDLDSHDGACRRFANAARCRVVSVDYRMAPEAHFPAAVDDCLAVTKWVFDTAAALGVDTARVAVGGDSAGGNLAAVMALMARDGTLPSLAFQLLIYPATDMMMTTVSATTMGPGTPLTSATMKWFIDHYMTASDRADWRASPIRAASLAGSRARAGADLRPRPAARRGPRLRQAPGTGRRPGRANPLRGPNPRLHEHGPHDPRRRPVHRRDGAGVETNAVAPWAGGVRPGGRQGRGFAPNPTKGLHAGGISST